MIKINLIVFSLILFSHGLILNGAGSINNNLNTYDLVYPVSHAPVSSESTIALAKNMLEYASASYCSKQALLTWTCNNCNKNTIGTSEVIYFSELAGVASGYLAVNHLTKQIVISFKGTSQILNWVYNLNNRKTSAELTGDYSDAEVHSGFNDMANSVLLSAKQELLQKIQKYPSYSISFTGHSAGGALVGLLAYKIGQSGAIPWNKIVIITFGQPRIGNLSFARYLNSRPWKYTRVTSYSDIAPRLPGVIFGYAHNQYNMHIGKDGNIVNCSIYQEDHSCTADYTLPSWSAHNTYWGTKINQHCI